MIHLLALATVFNMVCAGTARQTMAGAREPYSIVYRIDLDQGLWCDGRCEVLRDIVRVEEELLILEERQYRPRPLAVNVSVMMTIDLSTGEHRSWHGTGTSVVPAGIRREGQCERADFIGFLYSRGRP